MKPEIRFPEFKDEWQKNNLSELLVEHKVRNSKLLYNEVFSVAKEKGVINQIEHLGRSYASEDLSNYKVVFPFDIIYTKSPTASFPFGIIKQNKTGRSGIVSVLYAVFKPKNNELGALIDLYFSLASNTFNYLVPLVHKGAKNTMNISNDEFLLGEKLALPKDKNEQIKIVEFFNKLNNRIEQLRSKKTKLEKYRSGIEQDIFKRKLRFKNNSGQQFPTWETRKVKELLKRYSNPVEIEKDRIYKEIGIRSHGKGIFYKDTVKGLDIGNKRVYWIKENMLIMNIVFAWERAVAKTSIKDVGLIASHRFPMYEPIKGILDLDYILHFFLSPKGEYLLKIASPGGAGRNKTLGRNEFENLKLIIPSVEEQTKIANFLSAIDKKINHCQQQIEKTEQWKKGLLQKMFV